MAWGLSDRTGLEVRFVGWNDSDRFLKQELQKAGLGKVGFKGGGGAQQGWKWTLTPR